MKIGYHTLRWFVFFYEIVIIFPFFRVHFQHSFVYFISFRFGLRFGLVATALSLMYITRAQRKKKKKRESVDGAINISSKAFECHHVFFSRSRKTLFRQIWCRRAGVSSILCVDTVHSVSHKLFQSFLLFSVAAYENVTAFTPIYDFCSFLFHTHTPTINVLSDSRCFVCRQRREQKKSLHFKFHVTQIRWGSFCV